MKTTAAETRKTSLTAVCMGTDVFRLVSTEFGGARSSGGHEKNTRKIRRNIPVKRVNTSPAKSYSTTPRGSSFLRPGCPRGGLLQRQVRQLVRHPIRRPPEHEAIRQLHRPRVTVGEADVDRAAVAGDQETPVVVVVSDGAGRL